MTHSILLVDDEPNVLEGLLRALYFEPYRFRFAKSGEHALEILANEAFDIIISDEQMPGMNGSEFLSLVRKMYPKIIRIILTGKANTASAINAIHDGQVYKYLNKPFHSGELKAIIRIALLEQSLLMEGEEPQFVMSSQEQKELLKTVAKKV